MSKKYFRTPHLPYSPGGTSDDKRLARDDHFLGEEIVVTEKMDGSNVCLTSEAVFARSHASAPSHPSFAPLKALHATLRGQIPTGISIFGEWVFAEHSIAYSALPSHLMVFAVRDDETGEWLSWDDVCFFAQELGFQTVPVLFRGETRDLKRLVAGLDRASRCGAAEKEGIVVRKACAWSDPTTSIAKFVRADHVQTDKHWKTQQIQINKVI
jgi:hypothetical protein